MLFWFGLLLCSWVSLSHVIFSWHSQFDSTRSPSLIPLSSLIQVYLWCPLAWDFCLLTSIMTCSPEFCLNLINVASKLFFCFIIFQCQKHWIWILAFIRKLCFGQMKKFTGFLLVSVSVPLFFRQDCVNPNRKAVPTCILCFLPS